MLLLLDGSERPIRRPKSKEDQKSDYSGKKKAHRKKNLLVTREREIVYLGPTSPGSVHDKKFADESELSFPPETLVLKDSGFQGYELPGAPTLQPKKKPRERELYPSEKGAQPTFEPLPGDGGRCDRGRQTLPHRAGPLSLLAE